MGNARGHYSSIFVGQQRLREEDEWERTDREKTAAHEREKEAIRAQSRRDRDASLAWFRDQAGKRIRASGQRGLFYGFVSADEDFGPAVNAFNTVAPMDAWWQMITNKNVNPQDYRLRYAALFDARDPRILIPMRESHPLYAGI